jgi:hypothetical protein
MENIFDDEEIKSAVEEYDRSAASSLLAIKDSIERKSKKSLKMTEWKNFVKDVHNEISDNGRIKISYAKAMTEASKRKRMSTNVQNLNKIRKEKVSQNRSKKEAETQTEIGFKPSFKEIYGYKIMKNEKTLFDPVFHYEDAIKCISDGLVKILDLYMSEVSYEFFETPDFKSIYQYSNEDTKIFINCMIYTHFDKIFDEPYREELDIVDNRFMDNYSKSSLDCFWCITNYIFKNSMKFYSLVFNPKVLIRKIE